MSPQSVLASALLLAPALHAEPAASPPSTPAANAPAAAAPAAKAPPPPTAPAAATATVTETKTAPDRSGVVLVEQAGRVAALGVILNGDGRIVTSLSRIGNGQLFVRYASGTLEQARVGHSDAARDLALLVPRTARIQKGMKASSETAGLASAQVTWFSLGANRTLTPVAQTLQGAAESAGRQVFKLASAPKPNELGGPIVDANGDAAAIIVSGCPAGTSTCSEPPVALPVNQVRAFLKTRPPESGFALPRLGISGVSGDTGVVRGLVITAVEPKSPAATLGLRAGTAEDADILVAAGGAPITSEGGLRAELARHVAGDRIELLVYGKDASGKDGYRLLNARLAPPEAAPAKAPVPAAPAPKAPAAPAAPAPTLPAPDSTRK